MTWFLCLLSLLVAQTTANDLTTIHPPTNTTLDPLTESDRDISAQLKELVDNPQGHTSGNSEYSRNEQFIRRAIKWHKERLVEKTRALDNFAAYNEERLRLEKEIDARLEELFEDLIPSQCPDSECSKFFIKQSKALKKAYTESNSKKQQLLKDNGKECPTKGLQEYNEDIDYYEHFED